MGTALTRHEVMARYRTRSSAIGSVSVSVTRLPAGATVIRPEAPAASRVVQLLLPVDTALVVREREGDQYVVGPRELTWIPSRTVTAVYLSQACEVAWLELPLRVIERHPELGAALPPRPAPSSALVVSTRAFLQAAVSGAHGVEPLAARLFEDLLGAMVESLVLEARGAHGRSGVRPPLRAQAISHIAAFREDPSLTPQKIASGLRISVRQLQRAFEEAGTTVAAEIRRQRLEAAIGMLTSEEFDTLSVCEIAARAGFRNDAELRRALSAGTGATPSGLRSRRMRTQAA